MGVSGQWAAWVIQERVTSLNLRVVKKARIECSMYTYYLMGFVLRSVAVFDSCVSWREKAEGSDTPGEGTHLCSSDIIALHAMNVGFVRCVPGTTDKNHVCVL